MNIPITSNPRIVIVGGGFAGLSLAKVLAKQDAQVVLLDKNNFHTFQPLLYQVSTGGLEPDSIAYPIRKILKNYSNFFFRLAKVEEINTTANTLITNIGELTYDYLVMASGSKTNFFGNAAIEKNSMAMKTIPQSLNLRSLILENFEDALLTSNIEERNALMNFVIVGAGPTGVELAGALAEIKKGILPKDYPDLDTRSVQINLIQATDRVLQDMSEVSSTKAEQFLEKLGVNVWKNTFVTNYDGKTVFTNKELSFKSYTVIWAAGVEGRAFKGLDNATTLNKAKRIRVNEFNQVLGYNNVFAVGDAAAWESEKFPHGLPMVAQPAIQQGKHLGKNLIRLLENKPLLPFKYNDKGSMATIGRNKAVVELPFIKFQGMLAWFAWMFVHLLFLIGFRNRVVVFINWMYNYIKFDREARLIIRPYKSDRNRANVVNETKV